MKLICSVLSIVCFLQICLAAPAGDVSSESDEEFLSDAKIDGIKTSLKSLSGVSSSSVDIYGESLKKFREETPKKEKIVGILDLLSLALQPCGGEKIDLKQVLDTSSNESDKDTPEGIPDAVIRAAEEQLSKAVSAEQVQRGMVILRGFRVGATKTETQKALIDLTTSAMRSVQTVCATT